MVVSIRSTLLVIVVASGCADPFGTSGDDKNLGDNSDDEMLACSSPLPCPAPSGGTKQTVCGQLYDLATNAKVGEAALSLQVVPYDALSFAANPGSGPPLAYGAALVDACGRYRVTDIEVNGTGPFIAIAVDDAAGLGPSGTTVTTAAVTRKIAGTVTDRLEAWVVAESTTTQWASSGGPSLSAGVFVAMFRAHMLGKPDTDPLAPQPGVTATRNGNPLQGYYFADTVERTTIDPSAVMTGANGTVLIANAVAADGLVYAGTGGLADPTSCRWQPHFGASMPGVVFVQIFRPLDMIDAQCPM